MWGILDSRNQKTHVLHLRVGPPRARKERGSPCGQMTTRVRCGSALIRSKIETTQNLGGEETLRTVRRRQVMMSGEVGVVAEVVATEEARPVVVPGETSRFGAPRNSANRMK